MRAIARIAMKGPMAASLSAAIYAVLALFFAPFLVITGAIVALSVLRHGPRQGFRVFATTLFVGGLAYTWALGAGQAIILLALALLPPIALSAYLKASGNQGGVFLLAGGLTILIAAGIRVLVGDVDQFWLERLSAVGETIVSQGGKFLQPQELSLVAQMMHGASVVVTMAYLTATIIVARWWQASLYNPGGFAQEFQSHRVPRPILSVAAIIALICLWQLYGQGATGGGELGFTGDLLIVLVVLFALQGAAAIHARAREVNLASGWFIGLYGLMILMPHVIGSIFAFVGMLDSVVNFRRLKN